MSDNWTTWSPFQSPEVREICAHMTKREVNRALWLGAGYGFWCGGTCAVPVMLLMLDTLPAWKVIAIAALVLHVACLPVWRGLQRRFLCSTDWARARGWEPDQLRLFSWRRRGEANDPASLT